MVALDSFDEMEVLKVAGYRKDEDHELIVKVERIHLGYKLRIFVRGVPHLVTLFAFRRPSRLLINNWQSWGPSKVIDRDFEFRFPESLRLKFGFSASPIPRLYFESLLSDYYVGAANFLVGALTSRIGHPFFQIDSEMVRVCMEVFGKRFDEWTELEPFVILLGDIDELLPHYADLIASENKVMLAARNPVGWSSWYQYFSDFDYSMLLADLERAQGRGYEVFQIDDAWEKDIGDWRPNERFPDLATVARRIEERNLTPGIWLAPFSVAETSEMFHEHPDWLVKDENGEPLVAYENWNKRIFALDTTHPDVRNWLLEVFCELKQIGFRYFKIDFLFAACVPGRRYSPCTPIEALRAGLGVIREAVGDAFVLGCGAPLLPSVGFVDGMRIGADTAPFWDADGLDIGYPNAYYALRNVLTRWFFNGVLWWNDPDCLLLRLEDTGLEDAHRRLYTLTASLLDNMIFQSDRLSLRLDEELWRFAVSLRSLGKRLVKLRGLIDGRYELVSCGVDGCHKLRITDLAKAKFELQLDQVRILVMKRSETRPDGRVFNYFLETPSRAVDQPNSQAEEGPYA